MMGRHSFKRISFVMGVLLLAGMLISFVLNNSSIYDELVTLELIPKPEKLTELYFKLDTVSSRPAMSQQAVKFAFVIHNLEMADCQYTYDVSVQSNGLKHSVDKRNVTIKNGQYYVKNEKVDLPNKEGRKEIIVELTNKRQSIHLWIGET